MTDEVSADERGGPVGRVTARLEAAVRELHARAVQLGARHGVGPAAPEPPSASPEAASPEAVSPEAVSPEAVSLLVEQLWSDLADSARSRDALAGRARDEADVAAQWEKRAVRAVEAGRDDLARLALVHRTTHDHAAATLRAEAAALAAIYDECATVIASLEATFGARPRPMRAP